MAQTTIRLGSTDGAAIREAQYYLVNLGYLPTGTAPGVFGPIMDGAVRSFQRVNGLSVDGVIGPNTWRALTSPTARRPNDAPIAPNGSYTPGPNVSVAPGGTGAGPSVAPAWSFEPMDVVGKMPSGWAAMSTAKKAMLVAAGVGAILWMVG